MNTNKQWARNFKQCIKCNNIKYKHKGHGLCWNCYDKERYKTNPKVKGYRDKYRKNNPLKIKESQRKYHKKNRDLLFKLLGHKCVKCGFSDKRALQIDHIKGGGRKERISYNTKEFHRIVLKSLKNKEDKYQLLCANCNWIKRYENKEWGGGN